MTTETISPARPVYHIDDEVVETAIRDAVTAACNSLDTLFPGCDNGGITTNFAGTLETAIRKMLTGVDPVCSRGAAHLPVLALDDHHFGDHRSSEKLFVIAAALERASDECPKKPAMRSLVLNWSGSAFVPLETPGEVDPFMSFDAAVKGALRWLRNEETTLESAKISIRPVRQTDTGYTFADEVGSPA